MRGKASISFKYSIPAFLLGVAWVFGYYVYAHYTPETDYYNFFYGDIGVFLVGVSCFVILKKLFERPDSRAASISAAGKNCQKKEGFVRRLVSWISINCLGIFFVHLMVCSAGRWLFNQLDIKAPMPIMAVFFTLLVVIVSILIIWTIKKIRPLNWMFMK